MYIPCFRSAEEIKTIENAKRIYREKIRVRVLHRMSQFESYNVESKVSNYQNDRILRRVQNCKVNPV